MIKVLSIVLVGATLMLGGCKHLDGTPLTLDEIISQSQAAATKICGWAPAGEVIAGIIGTVVPGGGVVVSAASIGSAVCAAYNSSQTTTLARRGMVRAKIVKGFRVTPGAVNGVPVR